MSKSEIEQIRKLEENQAKVGQHINNAALLNQPVYFDDIGNGNFRPSDIDGVIEVQKTYIIMVEVKRGDKELPNGQRYTYQNMTDALQKGGYKVAMTVVVEHDVDDPTQPIMLKDCICRKKYEYGEWVNSSNRQTFGTFIKKFAKINNINKLQ